MLGDHVRFKWWKMHIILFVSLHKADNSFYINSSQCVVWHSLSLTLDKPNNEMYARTCMLSYIHCQNWSIWTQKSKCQVF